MKKLLTFILLMFSVLCFYSCSSNELEYTEEQDLTNKKLEAVANFNKAFQKEFPYLVLTRASSVNETKSFSPSSLPKGSSPVSNWNIMTPKEKMSVVGSTVASLLGFSCSGGI